MAIIGLGTDIVEIARVEIQLQRSQRLAERVLTEFELNEFKQHAFPERYLAKRFAAKEAVAKALGTGIGHGVSFQHIEVRNDDKGKPYLHLSGAADELCGGDNHYQAFISISDEKHYAVASVVLESCQ